MGDRESLLRAITANPDEDTPRLALADWLDENGEPERAELVRVQCELSRLPPKPRELFVADGAGTRMEGLGVALTPRGGGHYSASNAERGLSTETFSPGERVDVYAHLARKDQIKWMRGLKYVKHVPERHQIIFRKDEESGPWKGTALAARERELTAALGSRLSASCPTCGGVPSGYLNVAGLAQIGGCRTCGGTGDLYQCHGGHSADAAFVNYLRPHRWVRGCLYLDVTLEEVADRRCSGCGCTVEEAGERGNGCARCDGGHVRDWRPTPWAAALPPEVVGLWVTDKEPAGFWSEQQGWTWCKIHSVDDHHTDSWVLPGPVFDALTGHYNAEPEQSGQRAVKRYRTSDHARLHLAHALRLWVYNAGGAA